MKREHIYLGLANDPPSERLDNPWIYVAVNLFIGLSCALPLSLWRMEGRKEDLGARRIQRTSTAGTLLLLCVTVFPATSIGAQSIHGSPEDVVESFFHQYRAGDVNGMLNLYTPGAVFVDVAQRHRFEGRAALEPFLRQLVGLHSNLDVEVVRMLSDEELVVVEYLYIGKLRGEALHELTGNPHCTDTEYSIPVTTWFELRDGRIAKQTDFIDLATLNEVKQQASGAISEDY